MAIGFVIFFSPISSLLGYIPLLGKFLAYAVMLAVSAAVFLNLSGNRLFPGPLHTYLQSRLDLLQAGGGHQLGSPGFSHCRFVFYKMSN